MDISRSQDSDDFEQGFKFDKDLEEYPVSRLNELSYEELVNYLYSFTKEELIRMLYYHIDKKEDTNRTGLTVSVSEEIRDVDSRNKNSEEQKEIDEIIQEAEDKSHKSNKNDKPSIEDLINEAEESEDKIDEDNNQKIEEKIDYDKIGTAEDRKDTESEKIQNEESIASEDKKKTKDEINPNIKNKVDTDTQSKDNENKVDKIIPRELDLNEDRKVLLNCLSKNNLKHKLLLNIIQNNSINNLLLIRYNQISEEKLITMSEKLENVKLITIGFDQKVPKTVDKISINNPGDVRRMGILATDEIKNMKGQTIITYDSLDILTQYISIKSAFKFLHIFLGKLSKSNSTILLSVNSSAIEATKVNTVKPLFDRVLDLDADEISVKN